MFARRRAFQCRLLAAPRKADDRMQGADGRGRTQQTSPRDWSISASPTAHCTVLMGTCRPSSRGRNGREREWAEDDVACRARRAASRHGATEEGERKYGPLLPLSKVALTPRAKKHQQQQKASDGTKSIRGTATAWYGRQATARRDRIRRFGGMIKKEGQQKKSAIDRPQFFRGRLRRRR